MERFHQTLKRYLARQDPPESITALQRQIDRFVGYYNDIRPHRARGRTPPRVAYDARSKARPSGPRIAVGVDTQIRHDVIDKVGKVTLRYRSTLHHIGVGRDHRGTRVLILRAGTNVRIITTAGDLLRELELDPAKTYHGTGLPPGPPKGRKLGPRQPRASTMP